MLSRTLLRSLIILLAALVVFMPVSGVVAQEEPGEEEQAEEPAGDTKTLDFVLTDGDISEVNETFTGHYGEPEPALIYKTLGIGDGSGGSETVDCSPSGPGGLRLVWISEPVFEYGSSILGTSNVSFRLATAGAGLPASPSGYRATFEWGYAAPDANPHPHGLGQQPQSFSGPGAAPASLDFNLDFGGNPTPGPIPAGSQLFYSLEFTCEGPGVDWVVSYGAETVESVSYIFGSPGDPDTDGDGIPDPLDNDDDNDGATDEEEAAVGTDPQDPESYPSMDQDGDGFTFQQESTNGTSDNDAADFPGAGGFPFGIILLILLVVIVLVGLGFAAMTVMNRGIEVQVSHEGFQAIESGEKAEYEVLVRATTKKEEELPVILGLKGVPEDWSATLSPDQLTLVGGEESEPEAVTLTVVPPASAEYEEEAQITVTANVTDEEGNTSALKPGGSVKTKTIVNIGVTPPEGEGKSKGIGALAGKFKGSKKDETDAEGVEEASEELAEEGEGDEDEPKKKGKFGGLAGKLKRKKKGDTDAEEAAEEESKEAAADAAEAEATADAAEAEKAVDESAGAAAAGGANGGKPKLAMGKMKHDPADFSAGDSVTTVVPVSNKGDGGVEGLRLKLFVNDEEVDAQVVDLEPGDKTEVTFSWTANPDENRVRVKGEVPKRG